MFAESTLRAIRAGKARHLDLGYQFAPLYERTEGVLTEITAPFWVRWAEFVTNFESIRNHYAELLNFSSPFMQQCLDYFVGRRVIQRSRFERALEDMTRRWSQVANTQQLSIYLNNDDAEQDELDEAYEPSREDAMQLANHVRHVQSGLCESQVNAEIHWRTVKAQADARRWFLLGTPR